MLDDQQLLRRYAADGSEAAFAELVARYVNLVYSAALRRTGGDADLAKDVAQLVFTDLARKARSLPEGVVLAGWLHRATRYAAGQLLRTERRRQAREQEAVAMNALTSEPAPDWDRIRPLLDDALDRLDRADRDALLLRFFEQRSLADVGLALGATEDATRKRVSRALEKLRADLIRRGVTTTAAALSAAISVNAVQVAPAGLAATLTSASLAGAAAGGGTVVGLLKLMAMTKLKLGAISAVVVASVVTPLVVQHQHNAELREENEALRQQVAELGSDNEGLSNRVAQASRSAALSREQLGELLRLRGEVGLLRRQQRDLERLMAAAQSKAASTAGQSTSGATAQPKPPPPFQLQLVLDEPGDNTEVMTNHAVNAGGATFNVQKTPLLDHTAISSATVTTDAMGAPQIEIEFSQAGRDQFAQITKENINKRLAIVLDGQLYSAPVIRSEISGGKAQIAGSFTEEEARQLAAKINGAISAK
jgi:RNA polymerase sigma factor (sigma-70 family)